MKYFYTCLLWFALHPLYSQSKWSLQNCVKYAIENNFDISQARLNEKISKIQMSQSKLNLLPTIGLNASPNYNIGYSIDPTTYTFTNANSISGSISGSVQMTLFEGLQDFKKIEKAKYEWMSTKEIAEMNKLNLTLAICNAYLQIILAKELLAIDKNKITVTKEQLNKTKKLIEAGLLPKGDQYEIDAQLARDMANYTKQENIVKSATFNLKELIGASDENQFDISNTFKTITPQLGVKLDRSYHTTIEALPHIKSENYKIEAAAKKIQIDKGALLPTLFFNYSVGSNFINTAQTVTTQRFENLPIGYVDDTKKNNVLSYAPQNVPIAIETTPISRQLSDNFQHRLNLTLQIPIFDKHSKQNQIRMSKLALENQKLELEKTKKNLREKLDEATNNLENAWSNYEASQTSEKANKMAYQFSKEKNEKGMLTNYELQVSKNNYYNSIIETSRSKYEWLFRKLVLDIYTGGIDNIKNF